MAPAKQHAQQPLGVMMRPQQGLQRLKPASSAACALEAVIKWVRCAVYSPNDRLNCFWICQAKPFMKIAEPPTRHQRHCVGGCHELHLGERGDTVHTLSAYTDIE